jgi:hypothetical protein
MRFGRRFKDDATDDESNTEEETYKRRSRKCNITRPWILGICGFVCVGIALLILSVVLLTRTRDDVCPTRCNSRSIHLSNCTCFEGALVKNKILYGVKVAPKCPPGREYYANACPKSCPSDRKRTTLCGCTSKENPLDSEIDCGKYGDGRSWDNELGPYCGAGEDRYGYQCYVNKCPTERVGPDECLIKAD